MIKHRIGLFAGALGFSFVTSVAAAGILPPRGHCGDGCGTAFSLDLKNDGEKVLHSFSSKDDGVFPFAELTPSGKTLYGTTSGGGKNRKGTVFVINRQSGAETILHSFAGGNDGASPEAGLLMMSGLLYGTTMEGGGGDCSGGGCGTVFVLDPGTGLVTVVYSFQANGTDGHYPEAQFISMKGLLYGTTAEGGDASSGTVFSLDPSTGTETVLHSFSGGSDGAYPYSSLINVNGMLYGTTAGGGASNGGTVFSIDPATGVETVVHGFTGSGDGYQPFSGLTLVGNSLYGTTIFGGADEDGTVYSVDPVNGTVKILHSFDGTDGTYPGAGLLNVGGVLYGTTENSGPYGAGTLFSITTGGTETTIHNFTGKDGRSAAATLSFAHGELYGTTIHGGHPK